MDSDNPGFGPPARPRLPAIPAHPSVARAWLSVARHPGRDSFAAWAAVATDGWILASLAAFAACSLLCGFLYLLASHTSLASTFVGPHWAARPLLRQVLNDFIAIPLSWLTLILFSAIAVFLFSPRSGGTLRGRLRTVLIPHSIAAVPFGFCALIAWPLRDYSAAPNVPFPIAAVCTVADLAFAGYGLSLLGNALVAGSMLPPRRIGWIWMGVLLVWYALFVGVSALIAVTITHETPTLLPF
jgi:hypothetical protein